MRLYSLLCFILLLISCGKEIKGKGVGADRPPLNPEDLPKDLKEQEILCSMSSCPQYLGKLVVFENGIKASCAGTLIDERRFAINASCIPKEYRNKEVNCRQFFYTVFPATINSEKSQLVGCSEIQYISNVSSEIAPLNKDNIAIIKLDREMQTRLPVFSFTGVKNNEFLHIYRIYKESNTKSHITKVSATSHLETLANPKATTSKSQNIPLTSSKLRKDLLPGGIVVNGKGRVVGFEYSNLSNIFYNYLKDKSLIGKMKYHYSYLMNFSCSHLFIINQSDCEVYSSEEQLNKERLEMIQSQKPFALKKLEVQKYLDTQTHVEGLIEFSLELNDINDVEKGVSITPLCFKDYLSWINNEKFKRRGGKRHRKSYQYTFTFTQNKLKKFVDYNLNVKVEAVSKLGRTQFRVGFNPRNLAIKEYSEIELNYVDFDRITNCSEL